MYFLGIDAGGTKTAFALSDENGFIRARHTTSPCTLISHGGARLTEVLNEGIASVCKQAGIEAGELTYAALGIPGYGEKAGAEEEAYGACGNAGLSGKIICECDCYIGWAGSLAMKPGVNIIAGTGSICYGVNASGGAARSGGWGAYCDEGSCRWLGERLIALFAKQADGRLPRTALYEIFRRHFNLNEDLLFIHTLNHDLNGTETARLQILLCEAHARGDIHAKALYAEAAAELALAAATTAVKLNLPAGCAVSYSGGLFKSGDCILKPLEEKLAESGCRMAAPRFTPELGAVLTAMRQVFPEKDFDDFKFY